MAENGRTSQRVKLRGGNGTAPEAPEPVPIVLEPLAGSGVVYPKSEILKALQVYYPGVVVTDLLVFEDGEHFCVLLHPAAS